MGEGFRDRSHGATMPGVSEDGSELCKSSSFCGDSDDSVSSSSSSSSSSNVVDDATSSASSGALRLDSQGPLFELSSLMAQLPIKRGLSRYFQGKSQSFTSLSDVRCIEDLAKEETPYRKRVKTWRRPCFTPGPRRKSLAKKASRGYAARNSGWLEASATNTDRLIPGVFSSALAPRRGAPHLYLPFVAVFDPGFWLFPTMYRFVGSHLRTLKRQSGGARIFDTAARFASTSIAKRSSGGFFGWLTGGSSSQLPLDFPLPGVSLPPPLPDFVGPARTKITTLPNGLKIASEMSTNPVASIGLYINCGSVYETPSSFGATHLLERMAYKTTKNRSHLRIVREIEAIGGSITASGSREQMGYTYDALKTYMPEMVEVLIDSVRNAVFLDWEVNEQLKKVKVEMGELSNNPQGLLLEAIHSAAYSGALANPLIAPESVINRLDGTILEEFVVDNYTASRMVLAASGVEHEELVAIAEPLLSDLPKVPHLEEPKSVYTGGEYRCQSDSSKTHVALAFEVPGGWHKEKEAMALTVLQMLMGGGGSFSAGGPGKGMHSRLYLRVLSQFQQIESFSSFNSIYNHTGIFGIHATTGPEFVSKAVELAVREMLAVATPGQVDQVQLDRAKESTKSAVLMNLESGMVASEDIGRQILTYGERKPVEHFLKAVDELTIKDLTSLAEKIISSPLTMASWGDVIHVPSYESSRSSQATQVSGERCNVPCSIVIESEQQKAYPEVLMQVLQDPELLTSKRSKLEEPNLAFEPQCLNIPNGGTKLDPLLNIGYRNKRSPINHATLSTTHSTTADSLDGCEDEYDGVIINPQCLPTSANAFAAILRSSLSYWKLKGKKGIWLKLLEEQAELVPVALKEGFRYHHADPGSVMLTYWIPEEPCMLPSTATHQIGVGGFVINDNREVLVVKEKRCPLRCSGIWKLPTGFINKSEEIFCGAVREVKEETGIDTTFLEVLAFRHAHQVTFEKSDLFFVCMLKPLTSEITIDEREIAAAKWMPLDEFLAQPYHQGDSMSKNVVDICVSSYENKYRGFIALQMMSKLDDRLSYLYCGDLYKWNKGLPEK
ncbi:hypothetical protein OPV22_023360 [Ensete ventricosum]|uniref:Nudix hydrolase domain-containing protein n=1 Tax=Ensete ventricosum TaxID=4639 RepID=A0AAV8QRW5_ENSVE|nr:hypothetical protein OPV22_023360 [Ensete ventricosum]